MNPTNPIDDGPFLDDPDGFEDSNGFGEFDLPGLQWGQILWPVEAERRRATWAAGTAVVLADKATWHLPRLDVALLLADYDLAGDMIRCARSFGGLPRPAEEFFADCTVGEFLEAIGRPVLNVVSRLVRINYDLTPAEGFNLTIFTGPGGLDLDSLQDCVITVGAEVNRAFSTFMDIRLSLSPLVIAADIGTDRVPC